MKLLLFNSFMVVVLLSTWIEVRAQGNSMIAEAEESFITEPLASSDRYGFLTIESSVSFSDDVFIVIDNHYESYQKVRLPYNTQLPVGERIITIIAENYDDYTFTVLITEDETRKQRVRFSRTSSPYQKYLYSSYFWIESSINTIIYTDDDSEILIDGEWIGRGMVKTDLPLGTHKIITENQIAGSSERKIMIRSKKVNKVIMYNRPEKTRAQWLSLFPGASQYYKGDKIKGHVFLGLTAITLGLAINYQVAYITNNNYYEEYQWYYQQEVDPDDAHYFGSRAQYYDDAAKEDARLRNIFLFSAIGIYVINIVEALCSEPDGGYREPREIDFIKDLNMSIDEKSVGISYTVTF